jgi:hypothetical protein
VTYDEYKQQMTALAERWENIAEAKRLVSELVDAHIAAEQAYRCRFLAEHDPDVERLFSQVSA